MLEAGLLRSRAAVSPAANGGAARVAHGLWEFEFPLRGDGAALWAFLNRESTAAQLSAIPEWSGTAELFNQIGALTFTTNWLEDTERLAAIYKSLLVEWYADYYAHPFWDRLRDGKATHEERRRWVSRTYYLSRSVGASASKGALFSADAECRSVFRQNAVAEYDHCHVFYRLEDGNLGGSIKQLPASRLIDDHFLAIAECDQWGHVLSALYQEQTAMFRADVLSAYQRIERRYGISGLKTRWGAHLGLDVRDDHAGNFAGLFNPARALNSLTAAIALVHSWATARLLLGSIDEIVRPRRRAKADRVSSDPSYILSRLRFIALKALSNARKEEDIVPIGDVLTAVETLATSFAGPPATDWKIGLHDVLTLNQLQVAAERPLEFRAALARACSDAISPTSLRRVRSPSSSLHMQQQPRPFLSRKNASDCGS